MAKSTNQINKEALKVGIPETTLAVVDYRMGQVELAVKENAQAVREGFALHDKKLDNLTANFATKEELANIQSKLNDYQWYFRALVVAVLTALGGMIVNFINRK